MSKMSRSGALLFSILATSGCVERLPVPIAQGVMASTKELYGFKFSLQEASTITYMMANHNQDTINIGFIPAIDFEEGLRPTNKMDHDLHPVSFRALTVVHGDSGPLEQEDYYFAAWCDNMNPMKECAWSFDLTAIPN